MISMNSKHYWCLDVADFVTFSWTWRDSAHSFSLRFIFFFSYLSSDYFCDSLWVSRWLISLYLFFNTFLSSVNSFTCLMYARTSPSNFSYYSSNCSSFYWRSLSIATLCVFSFVRFYNNCSFSFYRSSIVLFAWETSNSSSFILYW